MFQMVVISYSVSKDELQSSIIKYDFLLISNVSLTLLDCSVFQGRDGHQALSYTTSYQIG